MTNEGNASQHEVHSTMNEASYSERMSCIRRRERWGRNVGDRIDSIGWAILFIWSALLLLAYLNGFAESYDWWDGWGLFFIGAAVIIIVGTTIRWLVPKYRRRGLVLGLVFGLILLSIGLGEIALWVWSLLLGVIGIGILYRLFVSER